MVRLQHGIALPLLLAGCATFQAQPSRTPLPASERMEIADRGQLRVIDRGVGEVVLLVHGYGASTASYLPILSELSTSFRVLAVDLPGFGRSDKLAGEHTPEALADVLAQVLDKKGVQRAHVVGHSWGGSIVLAFARRHPDRLARLVVISGFVYNDQLLPFMRWARLPGAGELLYTAIYRQAIGERMPLNFFDPDLVTQEVVDEVERAMASPGAVASALSAARGMRFAEGEYRKISVDTLILGGSEDRVARPAFAARLARELPRARLVLLPACGHIPMWECRGATLDTLRGFLAGSAAAP